MPSATECTVALAAGLVLTLGATAVAHATWSSSVTGQTTTVATGVVAMTTQAVDGLPVELDDAGTAPGDGTVFGQRLVNTGSLTVDARAVVTGVRGDLGDALTLVLDAWPESQAACDAPPPGGSRFRSGPASGADGATSPAHVLAPGDALCLRGSASLPPDADAVADGDTAVFSTGGRAVERPPTSSVASFTAAVDTEHRITAGTREPVPSEGGDGGTT